jgi:hypothetical protein
MTGTMSAGDLQLASSLERRRPGSTAPLTAGGIRGFRPGRQNRKSCLKE